MNRPVSRVSPDRVAKGRCCAICCCVSLLVVVLVALLGFFVIGPKVSQSMVDKTVVTLQNSTLVPTSLTEGFAWGTIYNKATMKLPGPFGVTIEPYRTTLSTYGTDFGYFEFPEEKANVGDNNVSFKANFTITNVTAVTNWTLTWMMTPEAIIQLEIKGTTTAKAFGFLKFHPTQDVILWCAYLGIANQLEDCPNGICMKCTPDMPMITTTTSTTMPTTTSSNKTTNETTTTTTTTPTNKTTNEALPDDADEWEAQNGESDLRVVV